MLVFDCIFCSYSFANREGIAKSVVEYCGKGAVIAIKGRLIHKTYDIPNYKTLRVVEVTAEKVSFIQTKPNALKNLNKELEDLEFGA